MLYVAYILEVCQMEKRKRGSAFFRGEEGMRRTEDELARQKEKAAERKAQSNMPFRFFVMPGETKQVIVVDDKPDFFMYEHSLKDDNGKYGRKFCGCVKETANCPVCEATNRESYYAMFLTVIDLTPFKTRDGAEVEFSRKLLVVKPAQQKKFQRFYNKEGSLRGALFDMTRDGDKDSAIGNDIEFVEFVPDEELESYVRSWKDKDGKKHNDTCHEPYDYEALFEEPDEAKLRALVGGRPAPGSRESDDRELGGRASRPARGRSKEEDDDWVAADDQRSYGRAGKGRGKDEAEDAEEPEAAPARSRARAAPPARTERAERAAPRTARRGRSEEDEEATDDDGPPFDADPPRSSRTTRAARAAPEDEPEDAEVVEEAPRSRRAASTERVSRREPPPEEPARGPARRASLRGRR